ncbi:MAG TPA: adenylate/guanylate cyclase domain-containing protein [Verrucomicrobiae bacterium]|nr:adenylate/guanylate cyclase domain-containing protein [Verrucomicrobiae bacterium]
MSANTEQRKLAAIMFTDMVGYSALSQRNEALAMELLEEHRRVVRGLLPRHGGREVKTTGDGFLLEFPSALAAVQGAVEIQNALHERNQVSPPERQLRIRIGIHVGDVVMRDGDIHGDGVNIAARIEPLAAAGGICISSAVQEQVRNKLAQPMAALGPAELKNIELPVVVHRVVLPWEAQSSNRREEALKSKTESGKQKAEKDQSLLTSAVTRFGWIAALLLLAVGVGWWFVYQYGPATKQGSSSPNAPISTVGPPASAVSPGAAELARVRAQLTPDRWQREDFAAMSPTLDRLIEANPESSDAWAMRSIINSLQVLRNYDSSTKPLEVGKAAADRAARLAPGSPLADIATGMHLVAMTSRGGDARACRPYLDRGVAALPPDALTRYAELASYWFAYDFDQVERCGEAWRAAEPQASFPPWIFAQLDVVRRRPAEADKWAEIASADPNITGVRAFFTAFESQYYLGADVRGAWEALQRVSPSGRSVHRVVHARWLLAMAENRWDDALQELAQVPETFLFDRAYHGPKALLAGLAHQRAGRTDAAAAQFREAERLLKEHLAADSDNEELHAVLAVTLAVAGRDPEARGELALVEPLVKGRSPSIYRGSLILPIAQAYAVLGDFNHFALWLRKLLAEPSQFPFTPASVRLDPRFAVAVDAPEIQTLLREFAALDQPKPGAAVPAVADQKSIAVLAFVNMSAEKDNEYFSDGITEEILNALARTPGLRVAARTSAFSFKGKNESVQRIGEALKVGVILEGSVRRAGNQLRITARLINVADGLLLWSDTFDRKAEDVFAIQTEVAQRVQEVLKVKLLAGGSPNATLAGTDNLEAYDLYLRGRQFWNQRTGADIQRAVGLFQQATEKDPKFAAAYAGLASSYVLLPQSAAVPAREAIPKARAAARRALELDGRLAEAHAVLGTCAQYDWDWVGAEQEYQEALRLNPNHATSHHWYSIFLREWLGKNKEALAEIRKAQELDPLSPIIQNSIGRCLFYSGRYDEALVEVDKSLQLSPDFLFAYEMRGRLFLVQKKIPEAIAEFEKIRKKTGDTPYKLGYLGYAYARAGRTNEARQILEKLKSISAGGSSASYEIAFVNLGLGDLDQAFVWFERGAESRDLNPKSWKTDPLLADVVKDARYAALLKKFGLDR